MKIFKNYNSQMSDFISQVDPTILPLHSWGLHLMNLNDIAKKERDIVKLNKLTNNLKIEVDLEKELVGNKNVIVITDLNFNIEFTSANTIDMTGYLPSEILGNTPKLFQGPATEKDLLGKIREQIKIDLPFEVTITNYKKDKSIYNCHIKGYPIFDKKGNVVKYAAVEKVA